MKIEFEKANPEDDFGEVLITAENEKEVDDMIEHFRLFKDDIRAKVKALDAGTLTHRLKSYVSFGEKYFWFETKGSIGLEYSKPYVDLMKRKVSLPDDFVLPDMELAGPELIHTYLPTRIWIQGGEIHYEAFDSACHWNKMSPRQNADRNVLGYVRERFGDRPTEREFVKNGNGTYSPNPRYGRGPNPPHPAANNEKLKQKLFQWWMNTHANDSQKTVIASAEECFKQIRCSFPGFDANNINHELWHKTMSWEQFRSLQ